MTVGTEEQAIIDLIGRTLSGKTAEASESSQSDESGQGGESIQVASSESAKFEFEDDFQRRIAALFLRDTKFVRRVNGLVQPEYFDDQAVGLLVSVAQDYYNKYGVLPRSVSVFKEVLKDAWDARRIRDEMRREMVERYRDLLKVGLEDSDFIVDKISEFARKQATLKAYSDGFELLEKGRIDEFHKLMEKAAQVGAVDDFDDVDYWNSIEARTQYRKDMLAGVIKPNGITTGIKKLDRLLYHHGWGRRELSCIMAGAKKGKSMALGHFSIVASLAGYNVLYVTLEVASKIIAERSDANVSGVPMQELLDKLHQVESEVKLKGSKPKRGEYRIVERPSGGLTPSGLRRIIERYRSDGIVFDLIVVDYADLMRPDIYTKDSIENSRTVWTDLRAIAYEEDAAVLTATQTNRDGFKADTAKAEHAAEDFNKIRIADLTLTINRTDEERDRGEARLYFAASRNGKGEFALHITQDLETMRFVTGVKGVS